MLPAGSNMRQKNRYPRPDDVRTATELTCFVYCPEAWRLQYGLGLPSENQAAVEAGNRHHARKAVAERVAGRSIAIGPFLAVAALVVLLLLLVYFL
jgi:hypothetical protein